MSYNNILVDIDMIIEKNIGIYFLLKKYYIENDYFNKQVLYGGVELIKNKLSYEEYSHPIEIFIKDKYKSYSFSNLYRELFNNHYDEIINQSSFTDIVGLLSVLYDTGDVNITIMYHNDIELKYLEMLNFKYSTLKYKKDMSVETFDSIYLYNTYDFTDMMGKNIYIPYYISKIKNSEKILFYTSNHNNIKNISLFKNLINPVG